MKDKRPFIESVQVVPMTKESIFEAGYVPHVEYHGFTTDMMTWKDQMARTIRDRTNYGGWTPAENDADYFVWAFPELSKVKRFMTGPTAKVGLTCVVSETVELEDTVDSVRRFLKRMVKANGDRFMLYEIQKVGRVEGDGDLINRRIVKDPKLTVRSWWMVRCAVLPEGYDVEPIV